MHEKLAGHGQHQNQIAEAVTICLLKSTANPENWAECAVLFG